MNGIFAAAAMLAACVVAHARPVVIEETARITKPDSSYFAFGSGVALDGDFAIIVGLKTLPDMNGGNEDTQRTAYLYRHIDGVWTFVRVMYSTIEGNEGDGPATVGIHMANGIALLGLVPLQIWERAGTDYVLKTEQTSSDARTSHMQVYGNRFIYGGGCWGGTVNVRDAAGEWQLEGSLPGDFCGSTDGAAGGPVSLWEIWAAVGNSWGYNIDGDYIGASVTMFEHQGNTGTNQWVQTQRIQVAEDHAVGQIAQWEGRLFVGDYDKFGTAIYDRGSDGQWYPSFRRLLSGAEWMQGNQYGSPYNHDGSIDASANYVMRHVFDPDRGTNVVQVFRFVENNYQHVATLTTSDGGQLTGQIAVSGNRVMLAGGEKAYYYELPASLTAPALIQETFPNTTAPGWTAQPGSQFTVVQRSDSRVYRQASLAGEAGTTLDAANWTNQAIQADVKPWNVNGADRWVGLVTRRVDAANYYYVTLRGNNTIQLKRMVQGVFQTLATAPAPFVLSRHYRLRLESTGSLHRVYLNGAKVLEARDSALEQGRPGLLTYKAAADYDNVLVSPAPLLTTFEQLTNDPCIPACQFKPFWKYTGGQWDRKVDGGNAVVLGQNSLTDWSRAYAGQVTKERDTIVEARARLRAFGAGSDPWFGVMARARDDASSYVYFVLRKSNTVTLRRVDNGTITQLGSAVFNVNPGSWYKLRLEAVGTRLRGYIDNKLVLEATDNLPSVGAGGLVTYHTQADYTDYRAVRP